MPPTRSLYLTMLYRALRLRCPRCGEGMLFRGWFRMRPRCDWCGLIYEREPGFFLGSIYVNYGLTAVLTTAAYFLNFVTEAVSEEWILVLLAAFCVLFPAWFFRYARSLWMGFDQYWDPRAEDQD
jgi:uncharacterized protein (DUF983 family)